MRPTRTVAYDWELQTDRLTDEAWRCHIWWLVVAGGHLLCVGWSQITDAWFWRRRSSKRSTMHSISSYSLLNDWESRLVSVQRKQRNVCNARTQRNNRHRFYPCVLARWDACVRCVFVCVLFLRRMHQLRQKNTQTLRWVETRLKLHICKVLRPIIIKLWNSGEWRLIG